MKETLRRALGAATALSLLFSANPGIAGTQAIWDSAPNIGLPFAHGDAAPATPIDVREIEPANRKENPVLSWNREALEAIKAEKTAPPIAARNLAILHAAIFDTVNGIVKVYEPYAVHAKAAPGTSAPLAAAVASREVLANLFPSRIAAYDAVYQTALASVPPGAPRERAIAWGRYVAKTILHKRANDGANRQVTYTPRTGRGYWQPTSPAYAPSLLPQWPGVTPFTMNAGSQFRPASPPAVDSPAFAAQLAETKRLGGAKNFARTDDQTSIAHFWADGAGTVTPPGHWNVIAADLAAKRRMSLLESARLFALLNLAEADAGIVAWDAKYAYHFWRPITAIRFEAAAGSLDAEWEPLLATPPFSEHVSGHSTFSGAAAAVLSGVFGTDSISFSTVSEGFGARTFSSFSAAAAEAGISRIYGGIHFMAANIEGLKSGRALGEHVLDEFLRPAR